MLINSIAKCRLGYLALECIGKAWATTDCIIISSCSGTVGFVCLFQCECPNTAKNVMQYCNVRSSLALRHLNDSSECSFYNKKLLERILEKENQKII